MTDEPWPDENVPYRYPPRTPDSAARWSEAVTKALAGGRLQLVPVGATKSLFALVGACPRCAHDTSQPIEFGVVVGALPTTARFGTFNVQCACAEPHLNRPDGKRGCGWGGAIPVPLFVR